MEAGSMDDTCPCCGREYAFAVPSRIAYFKQGEFYRCSHYGRVYFHRIALEQAAHRGAQA